MGSAEKTSCETDFATAADHPCFQPRSRRHQGDQVPGSQRAELLWFPDGKGHYRWHQAGSDLFMGIDHTALTVGSTENSLKCYGDLPGLMAAGGTVNMGAEQEQLDSLPDARARITGLVPHQGPPGVEFLEYEPPAAGRPFPADTHPTDLWHWQNTLVVPDTEAAASALQSQTQMVSTGIVTLPDASFGFKKGVLVRDSDSHAVLLVSP